MKFSILYLAVLCAAFAGTEDRASLSSKRSEELILSADYVVIRGDMERVASGALVDDRSAIESFARVLSTTPLNEAHCCFCCGWSTAYFYKKGEMVYSIAAIHGNQLRVYSLQGGGDFTVDEVHWNAVHDMIEIARLSAPVTMAKNPPKHISIMQDIEKDNKSPEPPPMPVTPATGAAQL
jgi:hypothetical protein